MKKTFADNYLPEMSVKKIFSHLQDDVSRQIFIWRYDYFVTRNEIKIGKALDVFGSVNIFGDANIFENVNIFGAGALSQIYTIPFLEAKGSKINFVCDSNRHGQTICGYDIVTVDEMLKLNDNLPIILSTFSEHICNEIRQILLLRGVEADSIIEPKSFMYDEQYFEEEILKMQPDEIYVDAGCMDGDTILRFREFNKDFGYKRIYGFEPDSRNHCKTKQSIEKYNLNNVILTQKGLWDSAETLRFCSNDILGGSHITNDGETTIETITLDSAIEKGDKVTLIKMDIEGAELNALYGAKEIIKRDKPRLAICVYHKPEDIINVASYILELNPDYKLYLRHYSPLPLVETVLYAI